jgi:dTMP kinase
MILNPHPGKFILLAGYDGCGKDTQAARLRNLLIAQKIKFLNPFPKEPTQGPIGRRIYDILFDRDPELKLGVNLSDFEFQKLYIQDSIYNYKNVIIPALKSGINVISNRGRESALAYGANTINGFERIMAMHDEMFAAADVPFIWPDLTIIYDITPETALSRMNASGREKDAFENELKARRVTSNYRAIAALYPNCKLVDAEHDGEDGIKYIFAEARKHIFPILGIDI